jgi:hypothetical protein
MRIPDAGGMGRPTMYLPGLACTEVLEFDRTLNRARRIAPQAVKRNAVRMPGTGYRCSTHL